jgi:hypothetical protein
MLKKLRNIIKKNLKNIIKMSTIGENVENMFEGYTESIILGFIKNISYELNISEEKLKEIYNKTKIKKNLTCPYIYKGGKNKGKCCGAKGVYCGYCNKHKTEMIFVKENSIFSFVPAQNFVNQKQLSFVDQSTF